MVKIVVLLSRRPGMSREEFEWYWREQHLPLVAKLPGLRRLVANRVLPGPHDPAPAYDGVAEDWFDDLQAHDAALASPQGQAVLADAATFLDMSRLQILVVDEAEVAVPTIGPAAPAG